MNESDLFFQSPYPPSEEEFSVWVDSDFIHTAADRDAVILVMRALWLERLTFKQLAERIQLDHQATYDALSLVVSFMGLDPDTNEWYPADILCLFSYFMACDHDWFVAITTQQDRDAQSDPQQ